MELYDAIFYRKSVREYANTKIKPELIKEVEDICKGITYLNKDLNIKAHVIERGHLIHFLMGKRCKVKAPHYILVTSNKGEDYLQNVGFAMEKVVLELTTLGIATCWLECDLKREDIFEFIDLKDYEDIKDMEVPCAIIAFGYPEKSERLFKRIGSKVDRYKARQISKKADRKFMKCLEAARMAPSIKNCQPWFYLKDRKGFHLYSKIQKKSIDEMAKISLGTSLYHFDLACRKNNMPVEYEKSEFKKKRGKEYFISIIY